MEQKWWKEAVMYQIYPRSFKDSNRDGIGDLRGIIHKIDHFVDLGVNLIWLGPIYDSPNDDNGYDIRDYKKIHSEYGTMEDFEELLHLLHQHGIRLIMDLVVNHTSDEHPWFREAKKSPDNPFRDYYHWTSKPNNFVSYFGGSAWEYSPLTQESYLHLFSKKQPDLNWDNPKVRAEIYDIMRFWLDKGIDGFRMDVISLISKRVPFEDSKSTDLKYLIENHYANGPNIHKYLREMHDEVLCHYDIMTVGEGPGITLSNALDYVGKDRKELNMIFQLELMFMDFGSRGKFDYQPFTTLEMKKCLFDWDLCLSRKGWNNIFLDNHDFPRMVSRFGNDGKYRVKSAKALALLLLTFRGTPCIYQGSEIGMTNVAYDNLDDYDDVEIHNYKNLYVDDDAESQEDFLKIVHKQARDNARTPFQWDSTTNAGFSEGEPWIPVNENYQEINLENDKGIYEFYKSLINFRKQTPPLIYGEMENLDADHPVVFQYKRNGYLIVINLGEEPIDHYQLRAVPAKIILTNDEKKFIDQETIDLNPWEAFIAKIQTISEDL